MNGKINRNFTIFGGTGDLTYRKLIPALYNLFAEKKLLKTDRIIIIGRKEYTTEHYISIIKEWCSKFSRVFFEEKLFEEFSQQITYYRMEFTDIAEYQKLSVFFNEAQIERNIFYFAVSPEFFEVITNGVSSIKGISNVDLIIEKPFGKTLEEAEVLHTKLDNCFQKEHIYRIDHYLGKEMVQSIQTIRFSNLLFKNSWDHNSIQKIEIIAHEEVGVENRAGYYDQSGALKDMVQNHLMQILSLIAMEEPSSTNDIKNKQTDVFKSLRPISAVDIKDTLILGQYEGYTQENGVNPSSTTETYALCKLFVDNDRWKGMPFYIKTGKKMAKREMNVIITFKPTGNSNTPNVLVFYVQPKEGVNLSFNIKQPGASDNIICAEMDFCQSCIDAHRVNTPEAYERLILAVFNQDQSLFSTWEQIYLSWDYINKLKKLYNDNNLSIKHYPVNSTDISI